MDVSDASYYITYSMKKEIKVAKWGTPKFEKKEFDKFDFNKFEFDKFGIDKFEFDKIGYTVKMCYPGCIESDAVNLADPSIRIFNGRSVRVGA
jgi:hypothetical protein